MTRPGAEAEPPDDPPSRAHNHPNPQGPCPAQDRHPARDRHQAQDRHAAQDRHRAQDRHHARSPRRGQGWWGSESALLDDAEARRRLVAAAGRCVIRRGSSRMRIEEVATEAGVSRSTVYRYFRSRDELLLAVLLDRVDTAMDVALESLPHPYDARVTLVEVFVRGTSLIDGDALAEALFAAGGRASGDSLPLATEPIVEAVHKRLEPLLLRWQDSGQLSADLDLWEAVRWLIAAGGAMMAPPWSSRSLPDKRVFAETYLIRALLQPATPTPDAEVSTSSRRDDGKTPSR